MAYNCSSGPAGSLEAVSKVFWHFPGGKLVIDLFLKKFKLTTGCLELHIAVCVVNI